jgi:hypothetical protein
VNLVIPPVLLYAFGFVLITLGGLRAFYLGWRKRPDVEEDEAPLPGARHEAGIEAVTTEGAAAAAGEAGEGDVEPVETERKGNNWARSGAGGHKRHLMMGLLYVMMGLFLVVSTFLGQRR